MVDNIMCALAAQVEDSGYFKTVHPITEMLVREGVEAPACYVSDGQLEYVHTHDMKGIGYFRKRSDVSISRDEGLSLTACTGDDFLTIDIPLRFVASVEKSKLDDDAFSDDKLALEIIEVLQGSVAHTSQATRVVANISGYQTDDKEVWNSEVSGVDFVVHKDLSYIYVDLDVEISVHKSCLIADCSYG